LNTSWSILFSYHLGSEEFELGGLSGGATFADGVRIVVEQRKLPLGERILFHAEPAPGGEGLFPVAERLELRLRCSSCEAVFLNGYQSWTESRELEAEVFPFRFRRLFRPWTNHYLLDRYGDACFTGRSFSKKRYHGCSFATLRKGKQVTLLAGMMEDRAFSRIEWRSERRGRGYLSFLPELSSNKISGVRTLMDLVVLTGEEEAVYEGWASAADGFGPVEPGESLSGWTSWYDHYEKVTEADVLRVLDSWQRLSLPPGVIQIDDGWQQAVGDWLRVKPTFPRGMAPLAADISKAGMEPGLWVAPFIAEGSSLLFAEHRDWFLTDDAAEPLAAGNNPFNWSGYFYALNIYHPEVKTYLRTLFSTIVKQWGFRFLKLDFLYAAALRLPEGKTRGEVMRDAVAFLREISGEAKLLGCGVPLASAAGLVEYCRVGADVALRWEDRRLRALGYPERVSTLNALRSTISRRGLDGRFFLNDPDVFLLRDWNSDLNEQERFTLFLCNHIFGSLLFTSDDPGRYDEATLALFRSGYPLRKKHGLRMNRIGECFEIEFSIGTLCYLAFINLENRPHHVTLASGLYYAYGEGFRREGPLDLRPHQSICFLVVGETDFAVAGSTGMLFPGSEVERIDVDGEHVTLSLAPGTLSEGLLFFRAPQGASGCSINGIDIEAEEKVGLRLCVVEKRLL
jgi:alpha-galactosidase